MFEYAQTTRLIVVSNRLPFVITKGEEGEWRMRPGSGGLVTALHPVLRDRGGTWVGWPGAVENSNEILKLLDGARENAGYALRPVFLTEGELHGFYFGFANEIIWPLFHDLQDHCNFDPNYWKIYHQVNRKYAQTIAEGNLESDFIWVHDYQLMTVGMELRSLGVKSKTAFFLHIPFPALDIFTKLPWRITLLQALLHYDLIGFQTLRDRRNFIQCIRALVKDVMIQGKSQSQIVTACLGNRQVRLGSFPISIDFNMFMRHSAKKEVTEKANQIRESLSGRQLILGMDRLDYTKGIISRLKAFQNALERYPDLQSKVTLVQVVVPSREEVPKYNALKREIEQLVGEINGKFTDPAGWVPIHYVFRHMDRTELLAYYRAAQIALVTPVKDGMNLVAKEYCTSSIEEDCVLILSEFAGAAAQMQGGALLVNPNDIEGVADSIYRAFTMPQDERRMRMRRLRRSIRLHDVFWWVSSFLRAAIAKDLSDFPFPQDYIPRSDIELISL